VRPRLQPAVAALLGLAYSFAFLELPLGSLGGVKLTTTELCLALLLAGALLYLGKGFFALDRIAVGLGAIVVSMIITTIFIGDDRGAAVKFILRFFAGVMLYLAVKRLFAQRRMVLTALRAMTAAAICFSIIGLVQSIWPELLDPLLKLWIPNKFAVYDPAAPLSFTTGNFLTANGYVIRAASVFGYCNTFSYFLVMAIGAALLLLFTDDDRYWRQAAAFALPLHLCALALTFSRGAWLALAGGILIGLAVYLWRGKSAHKLLVGLSGGLVVVLIGASILFMRQPNGAPVERRSEEECRPLIMTDVAHGGDESVQTRLLLWRAAWRLGKTSPLVGVGVDRFRYRYHEALPASNFDLYLGQGLYQPHNIVLTALANQGIIGLLALAALAIFILQVWWARVREGVDPPLAVVTGMTAAIGAANLYDAMMFDAYAHMLTIVLTLALLTTRGWRNE